MRITWGVGFEADVFATAFADAAVGNFEQTFTRLGTSGWQEITRIPFANGIAFNGVWADPRGGSAFVASSGFGRLVRVDANGAAVVSYSPALRDVIVTSPTHAVIVGWNMFLARWNGTRWTIDRPPETMRRTAVLHGVWSDGPSNAWAVGTAGVVRWNGTAWNAVIGGGQELSTVMFGVWGSGNTTIIVGQDITRCTGTQCAVDNAGTGDTLISVWGSSLNNVFAVGSGGRILRHDGQSWTAMTSPTTRTLRRVWGSSPADVWALGDSVLVRYNGTAWQSIPMTGDLALAMTGRSTSQNVMQIGLWGSGPNDVYVGGDGGRIVRFDGSTWRLMQTASQRRIIGIAGATGAGALAIADAQFEFGGGPTLLRGVSPTGAMSAPLGLPTVWY
jgi:hypothetical protein